MLEYKEWGQYDVGMERGYQTGYQRAVLANMILYYRARNKKTDGTGVESFLRYFTYFLLTDGQGTEFLDFMVRYPHMPPEKLAERIMKESEYIYGMNRDGEL